MKYGTLLAATAILVTSGAAFSHAEDSFGARFGNTAPNALESAATAGSGGVELSAGDLYELLQIAPAAGDEDEQDTESAEASDEITEEEVVIETPDTEVSPESDQYGHWSADDSDNSEADSSPLTDSDGTIDASAGSEDALEDEQELEQATEE